MTEPLVTEPVTASVRISAPPEVVFPYFTDPALATKWIADAAHLDARPVLEVESAQDIQFCALSVERKKVNGLTAISPH